MKIKDNQIKNVRRMQHIVGAAVYSLTRGKHRKYITVVDQPTGYKIEWCVWKQPYLRVLSGFIEL